ncbi:MAG: FMN-binding negative transcriptional regulator [Sphingobacteriia bacterium]|jgi:transcriptional regulator
MYNIPYYKAKEQEDVIAFMKAHPFIVLCGVDNDGKPVATHLPVLVETKDERLYLKAHMMRKQNHTIAFEANTHVLAIFHGEHSYISAQLYNQQNTASTWNYAAVHASGIIRFLDDEGLYELLVNLTNHFEGSPHSPASVKSMDEAYVREHMKAVVAFEMEITHLQHVFKLSQNKTAEEKERIIQHLSEGDMEQQKLSQQMKQQ